MTTNIYIYNYFTFSLLELFNDLQTYAIEGISLFKRQEISSKPFPRLCMSSDLSTTCQTQVYNCQGNDEDMNFPTPKHRETHVQLTHF